MEHIVKDYIALTGLPLCETKQLKLLTNTHEIPIQSKSHAHGLKLYRCVLHMNAYNVGIDKMRILIIIKLFI